MRDDQPADPALIRQSRGRSGRKMRLAFRPGLIGKKSIGKKEIRVFGKIVKRVDRVGIAGIAERPSAAFQAVHDCRNRMTRAEGPDRQLTDIESIARLNVMQDDLRTFHHHLTDRR